MIRNVSSHEEVSGSGLLHCVSSFVVLFVGLFEDRWLLHAEWCLRASLALNQVCACMRVCFVFLFFFFISSQLNVFTPKSRDLGSALYVRGIACYTSLSGLVQVL